MKHIINSVLLSAISLFVFASCQKSLTTIEHELLLPSDVKLVDGHLEFATQEAFDKTIDDMMNNVGNDESVLGPLTKSAAGFYVPGFTSIVDRREQLQTATRAGGEMTEEQMKEDYDITRAMKLLASPYLHKLMDTTCVIAVDGKIYKINDNGIFFTKIGNEENLFKAASAYKRINVTSDTAREGQRQQSIENGVEWIEPAIETFTQEEDGFVFEGNSDEQTKAPTVNTNTLYTSYNCDTYKWENNSVWQAIWDFLRGTRVTRYKYINENRRVLFQLYNVNYGFYSASGMFVDLEEQKKFLFVKYWSRVSADEITRTNAEVLGIDYLDGNYILDLPQNYSNLMPSAMRGYNQMNKAIGSYTSSFLVNWVSESSVMQEFGKKLLSIPMPNIIREKTISIVDNKAQLNGMFGSAYSNVMDFFVSFNNALTYYPFESAAIKVQKEDPRFTLLPGGNSNVKILKYDGMRLAMRGVKKFKRYSTANGVTFDWSCGFGIYYGSGGSGSTIKLFTPSRYDIMTVDVFGAIKGLPNSDKYYGVRFVTEH